MWTAFFHTYYLNVQIFFFPKPHTQTHTHTAINTIFFIHTHPVGEKNKKKESTKCVRPFEQKEANVTEPVNVPGSILSPQTSRRAPDEMTQNLLWKQLEWRDAWRRHHFRENFISDKPNLMLRASETSNQMATHSDEAGFEREHENKTENKDEDDHRSLLLFFLSGWLLHFFNRQRERYEIYRVQERKTKQKKKKKWTGQNCVKWSVTAATL